VTRLCHRQGDLNRVDVAHLADQHDVGVFSQGGTQSSLKGGAVKTYFTLRHRGHLVIVHVFNGILDRQDVHGSGLVDTIDNRSQSGRLT